MTILPSAYLPSVSYFAHIIEARGEAIVDIGEHYIKRSIRNRATIATAQGVMELTIPVRRANRPCQPMHSIEIDYSKRWQHQHWMAILSAYKSSPYFDHFAPYFEPLYRRETRYLVEFNEALFEVVARLMRLDNSLLPRISREYVEATPHDLDLRPKGVIGEAYEPAPYTQVFYDRHPFMGDLSILDLLMCEGVTSREFLGANRR